MICEICKCAVEAWLGDMNLCYKHLCQVEEQQLPELPDEAIEPLEESPYVDSRNLPR